MFGLGFGEVLIILVFAVIFIGPKKLPELAKNIGKGLREFQRAKQGLMDQIHQENNEDDKVEEVKLDPRNDPFTNTHHHPQDIEAESVEVSDVNVHEKTGIIETNESEKSEVSDNSKKENDQNS